MASAGKILWPKEDSVDVLSISYLKSLKQDKSARYERFILSRMKQIDTESVDEFCRRITEQVDRCRQITEEVDKCILPETWRALAIVDTLIAGTKHGEIQKKLIKRDTLTLGEALKELKQEETKAKQQAANEKGGNKERRKKIKGYGEEYRVGAVSVIFGGAPPDDIVKEACHMYLEIQGAKTYLAARVSSGTGCNVIPLADFAYLFPSKVTPDGLPKPGVVEPNAAVLTTYGHEVDHYGTVRLTGIYDGEEMHLEFFVVKEGLYGIIGNPTVGLILELRRLKV